MAAPRVERRLAAILAADVAGYSRLMERDEAGTVARLKAIRKELVEPVLERYGGRFVDLKGDGAIVEFGSVVAAVEAAVEIQRAMAEREAGVPEDQRIRYRIGINLGDVVVDGPDIYGDGVNVAARIEALCEPGGVWVAARVYDPVRGKLDVAFERAGRHRVKNISEPVETFRVKIEGGPARRRSMGRMRPGWWWAAAATVLIGSAAAGGAWWLWPREAAAGKPSVAVLPFDNLGGDEATDRLADGISEDIITDLARFRELDVIARNSTFVYKGKPVDVRQVGRDLNVRYVLEGSLRREADQVRVTAQLIDAGTGAHVWSDRWDRPVRDVFAVQTEVSERVAARLAGNVIHGEALAAARRKPPHDLQAYDLVLLAYEAQKRGTKADVEQGLAYIDAAIARDPGYARAYAHKAWLLLNLPDDDKHPNAIYAEMERLARKAIELDPNYTGGHTTLAFAASSLGRNDEAKAATARALELNPSSADTVNQAAEAMPFYGEPERGAELCDRSFRLNPNPPPYYYVNCYGNYFFVGRYKEAASAQDRWMATQGGDADDGDRVWRAMLQGALGQDEAAAATIEDLRRERPEVSFEHLMNTGWTYEREELERVLAAVRKVGLRVCATEEEIAAFAQPRRQPECSPKPAS